MHRGARQIGTTVITLVVMGHLVLAADAIERGWWNAARREATAGDRAAIDRLEDEAARVAAMRHDWLRDSGGWSIRWSRPLAIQRGADAASPHAVSPAWAGSVIAWNTAGAVHAVMADSGGAAWQATASPDTTLFPRLGPRTTAAVPTALASAGHLLFAVVRADGPLLACLDCSGTAEGRLMWTASPPERGATFDGPPAADAELCVIVCRAGDDREGLSLLAYDARDGRVLWRRALGAGLARDGRDHGRGRRRPLLHDDMVAVPDHAGSVVAFTRDGRLLWKHAYDHVDAAAPHPVPRMHESLAVARDTLLVAPLDRGGLIAIDLVRSPRVRWETPAGAATSIVGSTPDRVVIAATETRLESRSIVDGAISADTRAGSAILAGNVVLRATPSATGVEITPCDIVSLADLAPAFSLPVRGETEVALAAGRGALVVAAPNMLFCIAAKPALQPPPP